MSDSGGGGEAGREEPRRTRQPPHARTKHRPHNKVCTMCILVLLTSSKIICYWFLIWYYELVVFVITELFSCSPHGQGVEGWRISGQPSSSWHFARGTAAVLPRVLPALAVGAIMELQVWTREIKQSIVYQACISLVWLLQFNDLLLLFLESGSAAEARRRRAPLVRQPSLDTVCTNVTSADEFVWVDSHNRYGFKKSWKASVIYQRKKKRKN